MTSRGGFTIGREMVHRLSSDTFQQILDISVKALKAGGIVAVPTDTIYGLACLVQNKTAVQKIYDIKGRIQEKPIAMCVSRVHDIYRWCNVTLPEAAIHDLLPGPVTLVFQRLECLNADFNPLTQLIGVRIPDDQFIVALTEKAGGPLALTSANKSNDLSSLKVEEFSHLWPQLDVVVDGGELNTDATARSGSTVIDVSEEGHYRIIRPGSALVQTLAVVRDKFGFVERV